jgi:HTH-type transcriptional regulator / antitoxin HigA
MPRRTVRDDVDLENVTEIVDRLAVLDCPTADQVDYLETLSTLVAAYEDTHHTIDVSRLGPLETLKFLLKEHGLNASDLGRILGQRQLGSAILRGDRQLSKAHILKLAAHFGVSPGVFLEQASVKV